MSRVYQIFEFDEAVRLDDAIEYIKERDFSIVGVDYQTPEKIARQYSLPARKGYQKLLGRSNFTAPFDATKLKHGLYKIFWQQEHGGGSSLAAVGSDKFGKRWFAATNWTSGASFDWSHVEEVEQIA